MIFGVIKKIFGAVGGIAKIIFGLRRTILFKLYKLHKIRMVILKTIFFKWIFKTILVPFSLTVLRIIPGMVKLIFRPIRIMSRMIPRIT